MSSPRLTRRPLRERSNRLEQEKDNESDSANEDLVRNDKQAIESKRIGKDECDFCKPTKNTSSPQAKLSHQPQQKAKYQSRDLSAKKRVSESTSVQQHQQESLPEKGSRSQKRKCQQQEQQSNVHLYCTWCVAAAAVVTIVYFVMTTSGRPVASPEDRQSTFLSNFKDLQSIFHNQSKRFWDVVGAAPMDHLKSRYTPERPVVLLLVGQPGLSSTVACIANHLGSLYTGALGGDAHGIKPILLNGSDLRNDSADDAKQKLDFSLRNGFDNAKKAAVVHHFDRLPACSVLLFHSYCENDHAPYKNVAIILTIEFNEPVPAGTLYIKIDDLVNKHLTKYWLPCPDLPRGKIEAMLSRVGNNVALIVEEQNSAICPKY